MARSAAECALEHVPLKALDFSILFLLSEGEQYGFALVMRFAQEEAGGIRLAPSTCNPSEGLGASGAGETLNRFAF